MANYTKRTLYGAMYVFVFSLAAALFAYLFRLLLARNLSLAEFGLYYSVMAFIGFLMIFREMGLLQSVYYFVPRMLAEKKLPGVKGILSLVLKAEVISSLVIFALLAVSSGWLVENYFHAGSAGIIILFGVGFVINSLEQNFHAFLLSFQSMALYSIQNLARNLLLFVITLFAFGYFSGIGLPVLTYIITYAIILGVFSALFFKRAFPDFFRIREERANIRKLIKFGVPATVAQLGFVLITSSDMLILTYFRSLEEVGLYSAIIPIINLMLYVPIAIGTVILPLAGEMHAKRNNEGLRFAAEKLSKYMWAILIPMAVVLISYPEIIINLLFGNVFNAGSGALAILAVGGVFYGMATVNINLLQGVIGPRLNTRITLFAAVLNIVLNLLLVPRHGIMGAAIGTSVGYLAYFIASSFFLQREVRAKGSYLPYVSVILCGGLLVLSIWLLKRWISLDVLPKAIVVVAISGLVYLGSLLATKVVTIREFSDIRKQIISK